MIIQPTWLGQPLYPGGFPLKPTQITAGDRTVHQIYFDGITGDDGDGVQVAYSDDDTEALKSYVIYYLRAPIWKPDRELPTDDEMMKWNLWDLITICMDNGLDPF